MIKLKILDLGCGPNKVKGAIGVDIIPLNGVDIIADLFEWRYPFADNTFDEIHLYDVIEHLPNTIRTMEEIYRIAKPESKIIIRVVNWNCIYTAMDPTHLKAFTDKSFDFFGSRPGRNYYTKARFDVVHIDRRYNTTVERCILSKRIMYFLSQYLCNILMGLTFELKTIKPLPQEINSGETVFDLIRCPSCRSKLINSQPWLLCRGCGKKYPVIDGIPIMIEKEAEKMIGLQTVPQWLIEKYSNVSVEYI